MVGFAIPSLVRGNATAKIVSLVPGPTLIVPGTRPDVAKTGLRPLAGLLDPVCHAILGSRCRVAAWLRSRSIRKSNRPTFVCLFYDIPRWQKRNQHNRKYR
jgi:hypothetical protein